MRGPCLLLLLLLPAGLLLPAACLALLPLPAAWLLLLGRWVDWRLRWWHCQWWAEPRRPEAAQDWAAFDVECGRRRGG
jgi:hypothetical protein